MALITFPASLVALALALLLLRAAVAVPVLLQLAQGVSFDQFQSKYLQLNSANEIDLRHVQIGSFRAILGDFDLNFVKSLYFDDDVESLSIDRHVQAADLLNGRPLAVERFAPKHLVRISQRSRLLKHQAMNYEFHWQPSVNVYLLDTGVLANHSDFGGRIRPGWSYLPLFSDGQTQTQIGDHGTAVASVVGSSLLGVAKNATMVDMKVLDATGRGSLGDVLVALAQVLEMDTTEHQTQLPAVLLLPFIGDKSHILDAAVEQMAALGYAVVVAAGNFGDDACKYSPAGADGVLTVGAINAYTDRPTKFTNRGHCVDLFADGVAVQTMDGANEKVALRSGTSYSAAMAAGAVANLLAQNCTAEEAFTRILHSSVNGILHV